MSPNRSAVVAFLLVPPFFLLNFVVVFRFEPIYGALGSIHALSSSPWLPTLLLALFPVALFITIRPMLRKDAMGKHHFYVLNAALAACILVATVLLWGGLGEDIIKCNVLKIPNCD